MTGGTVLVAEDSMVVRAMVCEQLEDEGYAVIEADDGPSALERSRATQPDAILLDIEMPGLSGLEVLEALKQDPLLQDTPVVFLTGRTSTADVVAGLRAGAQDYLRKPFEEADLLARIAAAVRVKHLQDQLRQRNLELDQLSRLDALTGLYNRRHMDEQLNRRQITTRRADRAYGLVLLDIDHFKHINDTYGHGGGDTVLVEVARRLRSAVRPDDVVGRWGGEEFLILMPHADLPGAVTTGERVRVTIASTPVSIGDRQVTVTVSGGCVSDPFNDPEDVVRQADDALYAAKADGRNRIVAAPRQSAS